MCGIAILAMAQARFPETLPVERRTPPSPRGLFRKRRLRAERTPAQMLLLGTGLLLAGGVLVLIGTRIDALGRAGFLVPMLIYFFGVGVTSPCAGALALAPVREIAGTASAAIGVSVMTAGAVSSYVTITLGGSSPAVFALVVAAMGALAAVLACLIALRAQPAIRRQPR